MDRGSRYLMPHTRVCEHVCVCVCACALCMHEMVPREGTQSNGLVAPYLSRVCVCVCVCALCGVCVCVCVYAHSCAGFRWGADVSSFVCVCVRACV